MGIDRSHIKRKFPDGSLYEDTARFQGFSASGSQFRDLSGNLINSTIKKLLGLGATRTRFPDLLSHALMILSSRSCNLRLFGG
jgi:hypothetical protein